MKYQRRESWNVCSLEAMAIPPNGNVIETVGMMKLNSRGKIKAGEVRVRPVLEISGKVVRGTKEANAERPLEDSDK